MPFNGRLGFYLLRPASRASFSLTIAHFGESQHDQNVTCSGECFFIWILCNLVSYIQKLLIFIRFSMFSDISAETY